MSSSSTRSSGRHPAAPGIEAVQWRSWPVRDNTIRTSLVIAGLVVAGVVVGLLAGRAYLALLAVAVLAASLWRFFLPVDFELGDRGIGQRCCGRERHIPWQAIGRYEVCTAGVLLLPDDESSAMAPLRGLYLPFGARREEILAQVERYLEPTAKPLTPGSSPR